MVLDEGGCDVNNQIKFVLDETQIPKSWYNIAADLPVPLPPVLHPGTQQPVGPGDLAPLFPMALILQEVSTEREIEIPEPVREVYRQWRPSPLHPRPPSGAGARTRRRRSTTSTKASARPAATSPTPRCRRPSTTREAGIKRLTTETGAGQWGSALAFAGALFGIEVEVYMVRVLLRSEALPPRPDGDLRRALRRLARPNETDSGRAILAQRPDHPGSLGIAISEAVEVAAQRDDTKYSLGSVLNHVLLHQTVIGQEAMLQFEMAGDDPDIIIGCTGGGSNFAGIALPLPRRATARRPETRASSPSSRPPARR